MGTLKEPERITLVDGLKLLESYLPVVEAKIGLRQAFIQKAFRQEPQFALSYDEADIDWTTGSVKIPRKRDRFSPTFSRAEFNAYFFKEAPPMLDRVPLASERREGKMADDEISDEGRRARFEQWEKLGADAVKQDLATGGHRLVGGPPQVPALAREWVRMKEQEAEDSPSKGPTYARETVIAAADMLKALGHTGFDRFILELDLPDCDVGRGNGLLARATSLAAYAMNNPTTLTPERRTIPYEVIRRATTLWREGAVNNLRDEDRHRFEQAMKREGQELALIRGHDDASLPLSEAGPDIPPVRKTIMKSPVADFARKVFIVHGHEDAPREAVARFLEKLGLEAIILHERANAGRTVIEKVEAHGDVGFAVVLLTPDDLGCAKGGTPSPRARQNVILELGYFIGHLGRKQVCALKLGELEIPSDFGGVVYETFDTSGGWKQKLGRELEASGYKINWNTVMRS
jgi:hypothetical protein